MSKVQCVKIDGGISSFQIIGDEVLIRGTFKKEDLLEIIEILDGQKEKHSKFWAESDSF